MSTINFSGLVLCMSGATCHAIYKYKHARKRHFLEIENIKLNTTIDSFSDSSDDGLYRKQESYQSTVVYP